MTKHTPQAIQEMARRIAEVAIGEMNPLSWLLEAYFMLRDLANEAEAVQVSVSDDEVEIAFIEEWLRFRYEPIGMKCCGHTTQHGCCGNFGPEYRTDSDVVKELLKRHQELLQNLDASSSKS
jgi:hypothetical protein